MGKDREITPEGSTIVFWCEEHGISIWEQCCGGRYVMGWYQSESPDGGLRT
jgi:hypothetical protein